MASEFRHTRTRPTHFTPIALDNLKPNERPYEVAEPGGLRIVVGKSAKTFIYRYRSPITGKSSKLVIGRWPGKSLTEARTAVTAARDQVQAGTDPQAHRKLIQQDRRAAPTVGALVEQFIAQLPAGKRTRDQDAAYLRKHVLPLWGDVRVTLVTRRDVKALVLAHAERAPVGAGHLLGYVRRLFDFAVELEHIELNPASGIKPPAKATARQRVLDHGEIRQFWFGLDKDDVRASEPVKLMLRFALVTAQRLGEVRQMRWEDISGDWWTVPPAVSKNKLAHRVYLTATAKELIAQAQAKAGESDRVFRGRAKVRGGVTSYLVDRCAPQHAVKRSQAALGIAEFGIHDLRRTAASQMAAAGIPRAIIAKVLNHAERGVTAVYDRHSYDAEKADALTVWAAQLERILAGAPAAAPAAPDLEAQLAACEAAHRAAPNDAALVAQAIALAFQMGRMPPAWAVAGYLQNGKA